jgi:hypothetical protein
MDWHIITSGKGGVGKTLMSLMLSAYNAASKHVLIIDLNGMNADLCRLVAASSSNEDDYLFLNLGKQVGHFYFERVRDPERRLLSYVSGWPVDAFKTFNPDSFRELFLTLNDKIKYEIRNKFGYTIEIVIIDTNYHFCNIFPEMEEDYESEPFKSFLQDESIFVWFLWVYRQLTNLMEVHDDPANPHQIAASTVQLRAGTIEAKIRNNTFGNPFVHVFSPLSIGQISNQNLLKQLFRPLIGGGDISIIEPLEKLMGLIVQGTIGESTQFSEFVNRLKTARDIVRENEENIEDVNLFFFKVLDVYVSSLQSCPCNIVPIHIYQKNLLGYTEANYDGLLNQVYNLAVYKDNFEKAYSALVTR